MQWLEKQGEDWGGEGDPSKCELPGTERFSLYFLALKDRQFVKVADTLFVKRNF